MTVQELKDFICKVEVDIEDTNCVEIYLQDGASTKRLLVDAIDFAMDEQGVLGIYLQRRK